MSATPTTKESIPISVRRTMSFETIDDDDVSLLSANLSIAEKNPLVQQQKKKKRLSSKAQVGQGQCHSFVMKRREIVAWVMVTLQTLAIVAFLHNSSTQKTDFAKKISDHSSTGNGKKYQTLKQRIENDAEGRNSIAFSDNHLYEEIPRPQTEIGGEVKVLRVGKDGEEIPSTKKHYNFPSLLRKDVNHRPYLYYESRYLKANMINSTFRDPYYDPPTIVYDENTDNSRKIRRLLGKGKNSTKKESSEDEELSDSEDESSSEEETPHDLTAEGTSPLIRRAWHSNRSPNINNGFTTGSCWCSTDEFCLCTPALAVDIILTEPMKADNENGEDDTMVWLVKRVDSNELALSGGFNELGETVEEASRREMKEEMGIDLPDTPLDLIGVYSDPKRDPRKHPVSVVFHMELPTGDGNMTKYIVEAGDDAKEVVRMPLSQTQNLKSMHVDHKTILKDFIDRRKAQKERRRKEEGGDINSNSSTKKKKKKHDGDEYITADDKNDRRRRIKENGDNDKEKERADNKLSTPFKRSICGF